MIRNIAIQALEECEKCLQRAGADAFAVGDYPTVNRIKALAQSVADLAAAEREINNSHPTEQAPTVPPIQQQRTPTRARAAGDTYPHFMRRGDELVKIGWSKRERKEYHHRAPRRTLDALIAAVKRAGANGNGFTSEQLNPLKDPESDGVFPTYQVFVALAWLRQLGLVQQHGRKGGYTLTDRPIEATIAAAWPELPNRRA